MTDDKELTVTSLFSGLGGLDLGFEWEGFKLVYANDVSRVATQSYELNFRRESECEDITRIPLEYIPKANVVIGGPPCQAFSLVGKRDPSDPRGSLVFRFLDVVQHIEPDAFVLENVPGMAASKINGVRLTDHLIHEFIKLGYNVTPMELVATDYLVPQKRKRIILVGSKYFQPNIPDKFDFAQACYGIDYNTYDLSAAAAIGDLGECTVKGVRAKYNDVPPSTFAKLMRQRGWKDVSLHEQPRMSETDRTLIEYIPPGGNYLDVPDEVATGRIMKFKETGGRTTTYGRLHPDRPSYTINTYFRRPNVGSNFHYAYARLITAREAMRFQSFPDHFEITNGGAQDKRNALIGNAVPPLMARAIAWSLKKELQLTLGHNVVGMSLA